MAPKQPNEPIEPDEIPQSEDELLESEAERLARESEKALDKAITRLPPG